MAQFWKADKETTQTYVAINDSIYTVINLIIH